MSVCVYHGCSNTSFNSPDTSFFKFPVNTDQRFSLWVERTGNEKLLKILTKKELSSRRVCDKHFHWSDICVNNKRKFLSWNALPIPYKELAVVEGCEIPTEQEVVTDSSQKSASHVSIKWINHLNCYSQLLENEMFTDATVCVEGRSIKCHKLILSCFSPHLSEILSGLSAHEHPVLFLNYPYWVMKVLMDYMYSGEANVEEEKLDEVLEAAKELRLRGLMVHKKKMFNKVPNVTPSKQPVPQTEQPSTSNQTKKVTLKQITKTGISVKSTAELTDSTKFSPPVEVDVVPPNSTTEDPNTKPISKIIRKLVVKSNEKLFATPTKIGDVSTESLPKPGEKRPLEPRKFLILKKVKPNVLVPDFNKTTTTKTPPPTNKIIRANVVAVDETAKSNQSKEKSSTNEMVTIEIKDEPIDVDDERTDPCIVMKTPSRSK